MKQSAVVLVGHGSQISPETAGLVWRLVDRLRTLNVADEVTAAFWKEPPGYHTVLGTLSASDITVIPLFVSNGYFSKAVIPEEMGLKALLTQHGDRLIRYTAPIGSHPQLAETVYQRAKATISAFGLPAEQVAIAVLGHATKRDPESRLATEDNAERLRAAGLAREVVALYLDDDPPIEALYRLTSAPVIVAIPYFFALGSHAGIDIPRRLGLEPCRDSGLVQGRTIYYTPPVGDDQALIEVLLDLARQSGASLRLPGTADQPEQWAGFPQTGIDALIKYYLVTPYSTFGELALMPGEVRHQSDRDADTAALDTLRTPTEIRDQVRMPGFFRSFPTRRDLPRGWRIPFDTVRNLPAIIETIYPGLIADWAQAQIGALEVTPLAEVIARQVGQFRRLAALPAAERDQLVATVCGVCIRSPTWASRDWAVDLPCPEVCNVWLSSALQSVQAIQSMQSTETGN